MLHLIQRQPTGLRLRKKLHLSIIVLAIFSSSSALAIECKLQEFPDRTFVCESVEHHRGVQDRRIVNIKVEASTTTPYVNGEDGSRDFYKITESLCTFVRVKDAFGMPTKAVMVPITLKVGDREYLGYDENSGYWLYIEHMGYEQLTNLAQATHSNMYRCIPSQ